MIVLIPITIQNWETAAALELEPGQEAWIRSNAWSIAESLYHPELNPMGIYRGGTMVGFLMYGSAWQDGRVWLFRLMIDKKYQGQGLGREALQRLIRRMRDEGVHRSQCRVWIRTTTLPGGSISSMDSSQPA
ncbi:MAG: GNAT family N-acetyltransferase [Thermomicrobiales bacterium]|nr:GNAT family N-acetyltransferase [Thermomicrobiales bacterium]